MKIYKHIFQILIAIDQLVNTLFLGYADETISSRMYRYELEEKLLGKIFRPIIDKIFWFQKEHCREAYLSEQLRSHLPRDLR
nr:MAG: hypothetical protein [Caudoviricetes sp.]